MAQPPKQLELCFVESDTTARKYLTNLHPDDKPQYFAGRRSDGQWLDYLFRKEVFFRQFIPYITADPAYIDTWLSTRASLPTDR